MADVVEGIFLSGPDEARPSTTVAQPPPPPLHLALELLAVAARADRARGDQTLAVVINHITDLEVRCMRLERACRQLSIQPTNRAFESLRTRVADKEAANDTYRARLRQMEAVVRPARDWAEKRAVWLETAFGTPAGDETHKAMLKAEEALLCALGFAEDGSLVDAGDPDDCDDLPRLDPAGPPTKRIEVIHASR